MVTRVRKTGYFEKEPGVKSSSRLNATIVIMTALLMSLWVVGVGTFAGDSSLLTAAAAAGTIFVTIAGPAMYFMFNQKKTEVEQERV